MLRVRELAQAAGYHSTADLAAVLPGLSYSQLWRYWTGRVHQVNPVLLQIIASRLYLHDWRLLLRQEVD